MNVVTADTGRLIITAIVRINFCKIIDVVMRKSVKSSYKVTMGQAFSVVSRLRLAVEGASRENIRLGIQEISALQLK